MQTKIGEIQLCLSRTEAHLKPAPWRRKFINSDNCSHSLREKQSRKTLEITIWTAVLSNWYYYHTTSFVTTTCESQKQLKEPQTCGYSCRASSKFVRTNCDVRRNQYRSSFILNFLCEIPNVNFTMWSSESKPTGDQSLRVQTRCLVIGIEERSGFQFRSSSQVLESLKEKMEIYKPF